MFFFVAVLARRWSEGGGSLAGCRCFVLSGDGGAQICIFAFLAACGANNFSECRDFLKVNRLEPPGNMY